MKRVALRYIVQNQTGGWVVMAFLEKSCVEWNMRKYQHVNTTALTNTDVLEGASLVDALKLAWSRVRPGYWCLCSIISINEIHQVSCVHSRRKHMSQEGWGWLSWGSFVLEPKWLHQTIKISNVTTHNSWELQYMPGGAYINGGRVRCGLHNAGVYLGPRERKAKYQGHTMY